MIFGLLVTLYVISALFLVLLIMIQKSKGSTGIGALGGHTQMFFGATGGQDIFQKMTWFFAALIMVGSLLLSLLNMQQTGNVRYLKTEQHAHDQE